MHFKNRIFHFRINLTRAGCTYKSFIATCCISLMMNVKSIHLIRLRSKNKIQKR